MKKAGNYMLYGGLLILFGPLLLLIAGAVLHSLYLALCGSPTSGSMICTIGGVWMGKLLDSLSVLGFFLFFTLVPGLLLTIFGAVIRGQGKTEVTDTKI